MVHDRQPEVRIRAEGSDVVLTLEAQQAHDLARTIEQSPARTEGWLDEIAQTLHATADAIAPDRGVVRRRALRLSGYSAVPRIPHVQSGRPRTTAPAPPIPPRSTPRTIDGQPVTRRESLRTAASGSSTGRSSQTSGSAAKSGAGLAAAVAVFAEAISVGDDSRVVPPAKPPRKSVTAEERAQRLQEVLDAAAATSREAPAEI